MAYFATTYRYTDDVDRRGEVRPAHRDYLAGLTERGQLQVSGPFSDGEPGGALIDADPFVLDGLVAEILVREWTPVSGVLAQQF